MDLFFFLLSLVHSTFLCTYYFYFLNPSSNSTLSTFVLYFFALVSLSNISLRTSNYTISPYLLSLLSHYTFSLHFISLLYQSTLLLHFLSPLSHSIFSIYFLSHFSSLLLIIFSLSTLKLHLLTPISFSTSQYTFSPLSQPTSFTTFSSTLSLHFILYFLNQLSLSTFHYAFSTFCLLCHFIFITFSFHFPPQFSLYFLSLITLLLSLSLSTLLLLFLPIFSLLSNNFLSSLYHTLPLYIVTSFLRNNNFSLHFSILNSHYIFSLLFITPLYLSIFLLIFFSLKQNERAKLERRWEQKGKVQEGKRRKTVWCIIDHMIHEWEKLNKKEDKKHWKRKGQKQVGLVCT